jgi:integrase
MYQQYDKAIQTVLDYLIEEGFSKTVKKAFRYASRTFAKYLENDTLEYSSALARAWLDELEPRVSRNKFLSFRRSLALIDDAVENGTVTHLWFSYDDTAIKLRTPDCYRQLLDAYIEQRRQDGNKPSTLQMDRIACTRFLLFLQVRDITHVVSITPLVVKDYQVQAQHRTTEGKNAYIRRARGFVRFLAAKRLVSETLEYAFATEKASSVSIVTVLSEKQVNRIRTFAANSYSVSHLRNAAIAMLALRMGLRSIDICNLCVSDISWESRTISIVQQKTGVPLTLPFPVEVGNLLARYIVEGRPSCDDPNVFTTLRHPYTRLHSHNCYKISEVILGKKETSADVRGLHAARRTFASNLLAAGNHIPIISSVLGHIGEEAIDEYLATDVQMMCRCAIGLSGIGPKEVQI